MWVKIPLIAGTLAVALCGGARAEPCGPQMIGVSRTISVGAPVHVGLKTYPQTLDLKDHEVVLTFDDGPAPTTSRVLAALEAQCAKATFFLDRPQRRRHAGAGAPRDRRRRHGRQPFLQSSDIAQPAARKGHGQYRRRRGGGGQGVRRARRRRFFRFPGFADSPALLAALDNKNMPVFGADLWASDWNVMTPQQEFDLLMGRLRRAGRRDRPAPRHQEAKRRTCCPPFSPR